MLQVLQSLKNGAVELANVPAMSAGPGQLLIQTSKTLLSAGTERTLVEFGKASWLDKARQQPDKVRMVLEKARTDGLAATFEAVQSKLDQPLALGYCNVGVVAEVGNGVEGFGVGDRVVSNGKHAEVVCVPKNLCARVPENVSDEQAAFTVLAAIGLEGVRLANPTLGECVVVTGLGLVGLLTAQLLRAQGCRVLGIDLDPTRLALAQKFAVDTVDLGRGEDPLAAAARFSRSRGVDAVLITASTKSSQPVSQAAKMCRRRGRIVLVGVTGLELSRADFYEKELSFQVSCSYGPGRYDAAYEEGGQDYPVGYVRWTEQRNFEAVLDLLAGQRLDISPLISHRYSLARAAEAYGLLTSRGASLGILLEYPQAAPKLASELSASTVALTRASAVRPVKPSVAFIGAGNYASRVLMPAFKASGAALHTVVSGGGVSAVHHGRKQGFCQASTDAAAIADAAVDTVVVATRHDSHAKFVLQALRAGKHVFCEKPLCLTAQELVEIETEAAERPDQLLMVGFNRRFAPQVDKIKTLLAAVREPKSLVMTVNAGAIPPEHWTQDPRVGGGRLIGEACHFVDLLQYLADSPIQSLQATALDRSNARVTDNVSFTMGFADGSMGTVHYLANGHRSFAKERLEVFCAGRILQLDNFRKLRGFGWPGFARMNLWRQDKGAQACVAAFVDALRHGKPAPIRLPELVATTRATLELAQLLS